MVHGMWQGMRKRRLNAVVLSHAKVAAREQRWRDRGLGIAIRMMSPKSRHRAGTFTGWPGTLVLQAQLLDSPREIQATPHPRLSPTQITRHDRAPTWATEGVYAWGGDWG
jgi:hypothetical protein